jgi:hypothetical protein
LINRLQTHASTNCETSNSVTSKEYSFGLLESTMEGAHRKGHFQNLTLEKKLPFYLKTFCQ